MAKPPRAIIQLQDYHVRDSSGLGTTTYSFFVGSILSDRSSLSRSENAHSFAASLDTRESPRRDSRFSQESSIEQNSDQDEVTKEKPLAVILAVLLVLSHQKRKFV